MPFHRPTIIPTPRSLQPQELDVSAAHVYSSIFLSLRTPNTHRSKFCAASPTQVHHLPAQAHNIENIHWHFLSYILNSFIQSTSKTSIEMCKSSSLCTTPPQNTRIHRTGKQTLVSVSNKSFATHRPKIILTQETHQAHLVHSRNTLTKLLTHNHTNPALKFAPNFLHYSY